jgi:subtilisin family serine protease
MGDEIDGGAIEDRIICIKLGGHTMKASVPAHPGLFSAIICIGLAFCAAVQGASIAGRSAGPIQGGPESAYYAGESLRVGQREIPLFRSREKVAVLHRDSRDITAAGISDVVRAGDRSYRIERRIGKAKASILTTRRFQSLEEQTQSLRQLQEQTNLGEAVPVYVHGDSGLEMVPTGNIVVKLAPGYSEPDIAAMNQRLGGRLERRIRGTDDQYVLFAGHSTVEELFAICATLAADLAVEWVEPEFMGEVARQAFTPDDPLFPDQWHLKDINAPQAWDIVRGSDKVIIAIIDDGVEIDHEDLKDALPSNTGEICGDAKDNDLNGWQDDCNGWDFYDNDNNPSPSDKDENHGTQVAGIAVATGNNGKGVAGAAFGCRLMPLKVFKTGVDEMKTDILYPALAEAIYYAAGRTADGKGTWRGADVISMSLGFSETNITDSALAYAAQRGRGGKGCPIFCAAGNDAMGWYAIVLSQLEKGTYDFRWEYIKDTTGSAGQDTVWLDAISWPDGSVERFEGQTLPAGWTSGGDARWISVQGQVDGNHALVGSDKEDVRSVRAGPIRDRGLSFLATSTTMATGGDMVFWVWPSTEESYSCQVGQYDQVDWGFGQSAWPFSTLGAKQRRMQFICLREELGWDEYEPLPARPLRFMEFYLIDPPRQRLAALTIRMKQIPNGRTAYYQPTWDNAGWTTVLQAKNVPLNVGTAFELDYAMKVNLVRFDFTQEFMYDPKNNLAVDISVTTSGTDYGGLCLLWTADQTRAIIGQEVSGNSQPTDWSLSQGNAELTQSVPLMWLGSGDEVRFFVDWFLARKFSGVRRESLEVSYPASSPYAIAVGACTDAGARSYYSQYGPKLDFVAPSNGGEKDITTTDRTGEAGADPGNYSHTFGGTSAATPLASAVGALLLSKNSTLTAEEVRMTMRQTCQKIGETPYTDGRNDYYGYGRIDAEAAVKAVRK